MVYWNFWTIQLLKYSGAVVLMLVGVLLVYVFGIEPWIAFLIGFIAFVIYVVLVVRNIEKKRKILIKEYVATGNEEALEKAFPSHKSSKK